MVPRPVAIGLTLCEKVIIEERTRNVTLVNTFTRVFTSEFPSPEQPISVFAALTDGRGDGTINVSVTEVETDREIYQDDVRVRFADRLAEVRIVFRVSCSFPAAGRYLVTLLVDGEWIAQRSFYAAEREGDS